MSGRSIKWLVLSLVLLAIPIGAVNFYRASRTDLRSKVIGVSLASGELSGVVPATFVINEPGDGLEINRSIKQIDIARYTIAPGGSIPWHPHHEPGWVIILSGTMAYDDGNDPSCLSMYYQAGSAFMDPGNHAHRARNEGKDDLIFYTVFMRPDDRSHRSDILDPGNCSPMSELWEPTRVLRKTGR